MKCPNCGKELIKVGTLTETEFEEWVLINKKYANSNQALNYETIREMEFTDGQVFEYFRAVFHGKAEAEFLNYIFTRNLRKRLNLGNDIPITIGDNADNYDVYVHSTNDKE